MTTTTTERTKRPTAREIEKEAARARLLEWLKPGDTVYCILRHVSSSGMSRVIDLVLMPKPGSDDTVPRHIAYNAAILLGMKYDSQREGIKISGCGMDMGFSLVYSLGSALWPNGHTCTGENCRSNDHSNGDRDRTPHLHRDAGYALNYKWL